MKLKADVSLPEFLRKANLCAGDVFFETPEGDCLNMKSQLSKYVFLAAVNSQRDLVRLGEVVFRKEEDKAILKEFLVTE